MDGELVVLTVGLAEGELLGLVLDGCRDGEDVGFLDGDAVGTAGGALIE